jgi:hypothetical protein
LLFDTCLLFVSVIFARSGGALAVAVAVAIAVVVVVGAAAAVAVVAVVRGLTPSAPGVTKLFSSRNKLERLTVATIYVLVTSLRVRQLLHKWTWF